MKKLLISILITLCLAINGSAMSPAFLSMIGGGTAGCAGILNFVTGDTETFEYQLTDFCTTQFTETDPDGIISTYDTAKAKNGTHSCSIALTGINQDDNFIQADLGAADGDFTVDFWYFLFDETGYDGVEISTISAGADPDDGVRVRISHKHYAAGWARIYVASAVDNDTSGSIATGQWIRIEVDFNKNGASTVEVYDAADSLKDTLNYTAENTSLRYVNFGCISSDADATNTSYYDDVRYKAAGGGF